MWGWEMGAGLEGADQFAAGCDRHRARTSAHVPTRTMWSVSAVTSLVPAESKSMLCRVCVCVCGGGGGGAVSCDHYN